jgi:hypothetical protein
MLALVFVGMILLFIFSVLAHARSRGIELAGQTLVWSVLIFFIVFLGFTASAAFNGLPCNWAGFLNMHMNTSCVVSSSVPTPSDRPATRPLDAAKRLKAFAIKSFQGKEQEPRYWTWSTDHWEERTPGGLRMFHDVVGRISLDGCDGDKTRKQDDPALEMFIPDKDCTSKALRFRFQNGSWSEFGSMIDAE